MFSISKNHQESMDEVLQKRRSILTVKKPSYPRKRALAPIKKKAGQTSDEDEAPKDKAIGKGLRRKMENGPRKGAGTSENVWAHRNSKDDDVIHLSGSLP